MQTDIKRNLEKCSVSLSVYVSCLLTSIRCMSETINIKSNEQARAENREAGQKNYMAEYMQKLAYEEEELRPRMPYHPEISGPAVQNPCEDARRIRIHSNKY